MFTAGRLNGAIKTGLHVDGKGEPGTRLGYTLQRLMGLPITSWGQGSMQTSRENPQRLPGVRLIVVRLIG